MNLECVSRTEGPALTTVAFHSSPANVTVTGAVTRRSLAASPMDTGTCLVTVDAVLALDAGLAGRASEALSTLTHARAIHSVQADTVSEADVLGIPWAGLALGPEEARAALSRLQRKDKAGLDKAVPPTSGFVWLQCCHPAGRTGCVSQSSQPPGRGCENP